MKPTVKPPGTKRLILYCDKAVSNFGFKFNLRRYTKTRSKVALCPGNTLGLGKDGIGRCPFAKLIDLHTLPSFLGGDCRCKGGCICSTLNEQATPVALRDAEGMSAAVVPARGQHEVFVEVDAGDRVAWQLEAGAHSRPLFSST